MKSTIKMILMGVFLSFSSFAQQDNVIVLVDISRSVPQHIDNPARVAKVIRDFLQNRAITDENFKLELASGASINDKMIGNGKKLIILPFGDKETDTRISTSYSTKDITSDNEIDEFIETNYPKYFPDGKTYRSLAMARCADIALKAGINSYWLVIASDVTGDDFAGQPANYTPNQQELIKSYKSPSNKVDEIKMGVIRYNKTNNFIVDIFKVNLSGVIITPGQPGIPVPKVVPQEPKECKITLNSYAGGTKNNPKIVSQNPFGISWSCNCDVVRSFRVSVSGLDGTKVDNQNRSRTFTTNNTTLNLEDGKYRISVSGDGANATSTFIEVDTGGGMGILFILLILAVAGLAFYFWNKNRGATQNTSTKNRSSGSNTSKGDDINF